MIQFKKKYGSPCDVVAKDKCFYFAHNEGVDDEGEKTEVKSHFDFGLLVISMVVNTHMMRVKSLQLHILEKI